MKLTIEHHGEQGTFAEFAERHDLEMVVRERSREMVGLPRYYASLNGVESMERGMLCSSAGNGNSVEEAIADYAQQLRGKRIVVDAMRKRREFVCPNEWAKEE
jgi:hypothetical protein